MYISDSGRCTGVLCLFVAPPFPLQPFQQLLLHPGFVGDHIRWCLLYLFVNRCTLSVVATVAHGLPVVHHIEQCGVNAHRYSVINDSSCPVADTAQWMLLQVGSACISPLSAIVPVVLVLSALVCRSGFASW